MPQALRVVEKVLRHGRPWHLHRMRSSHTATAVAEGRFSSRSLPEDLRTGRRLPVIELAMAGCQVEVPRFGSREVC
jgi:hypothetical protein